MTEWNTVSRPRGTDPNVRVLRLDLFSMDPQISLLGPKGGEITWTDTRHEEQQSSDFFRHGALSSLKFEVLFSVVVASCIA